MLHLISGGYKKIGFIAGDLAHPSIEERYDAYRKMLTESGIAYRPALVITDEKSTRIDDGYHAMERMMKAGGAPRAVLAANDAMAIGAIQYLKGAGRRVPEDVAVVGFDDVEMSSHTEPRLTTVRVPKEEMGKLAARRLVEIIKTPTGTVTTVHVPVELVVRESCGVSRTSDPDSRKTASVMALSA
jgi:LacI family transcriptional regulator